MVINHALDFARGTKHRIWVSEKVAARWAKATMEAITARVQPFQFDPLRYPSQRFLRFNEPVEEILETPRCIFALWTGENTMPKIRSANLQKIREQAGVTVHLVTPDNLSDWVMEDHPIHPAYEYLSLTHRSDYLRAYLLHHHGGGYTDIKSPRGSWDVYFENLNKDPEAWLLGYPEDSKGRIPPYGGALEKDLHRHFASVMGTMAMITRPRSPLTSEWFSEMERRLDYFLPLLERAPGGVRDEVAHYPVGWTQLLADILYPLSLKYSSHIRLHENFTPPDEPYR